MNKDQQKASSGFPDRNPNPVLSSWPNGIPQYVNPAALRLCHDLKLADVADILPATHTGLVKTCLNTGGQLTREHTVNGHTIAWSYLPASDNSMIYLYGHDVTWYQPGAATEILNDNLVHLYALTPAETKLTEQLVSGVTLKKATEELGIAISTARSQLKNIFEKTGVTRQSELILRILTGPVARRSGHKP